MSDPITALITYLDTDAAVTALCAGRVYGAEVPAEANASMPRAAVVLRPAGGGMLARSGQDWADIRVDTHCYGATPHDSWTLHLAVRDALRRLTAETHSRVALRWARTSSDGVTVRDPTTSWPLTYASYQVCFSHAD